MQTGAVNPRGNERLIMITLYHFKSSQCFKNKN